MKQEKEKIITEIKEKFTKAKGIYLIDFTGMNTEIVNELRTMFRNSDIEYKVVKNSLTKIALKDMPFNLDEGYLRFPTGIVFSYEDSFSPIKLLNDFIKTHEKPKIKGSIIEGKVFDERDTVKFSSVPPKEELLARMLMGLNSPIAGFVGTLNGIVRNLLYVVCLIKEKREEN